MAVSKAALLKPLPVVKLEVNHSGLIIGGGLTGMTSALKLADEGFEVYLVEKERKLGGNLRDILHCIWRRCTRILTGYSKTGSK